MQLEIRPSRRHGRGVFVVDGCAAGSVLETCPALPLEDAEARALDQTRLADYVFAWDDGRTVVAFGFVSFCNHDTQPNAEVVLGEDPPTASLVAISAIAAGEEVLIDYGPDHRVHRE